MKKLGGKSPLFWLAAIAIFRATVERVEREPVTRAGRVVVATRTHSTTVLGDVFTPWV